MILHVLLFVTILLMVFCIVVLMLRPTQAQKTLERRLAAVVAPAATLAGGSQEYALLVPPEALGWVELWAGNSRIVRQIKLLLLRSQRSASVEAVVTAMAVMAILAFLLTYVLTALLPVAAAAAAVAGYLPIGWLTLECRRRLAAFNAVLPECIETCSRSLRAGHSITAAIAIVAELSMEPARTEFAEVFKKQNYGLPLRDALLQMLERMPSVDLQVFVTGILVQKDTGGNLAEIMDRSAAVIRDRVRIQQEIRTHTAQGRLTGWVLLFLPLLMMLTINIVNPGYTKVLFVDPFGKKLLYAGAAMLAAGGLVIRQIIHGIEV
ncbi:MAG TPA: type II secretion system F family protein [Granulicella sp.]